MLTLKQYKKIYQLLDVPVMKDGSDCGLQCNKICCSSIKSEEKGELSTGVYLYPDEELLFQDDEEFKQNFTLAELDMKSDELHWSPKKKVLVCKYNGFCNRKFRPIQCRAYPFSPYAGPKKLRGIFLNQIFQGYCPLLEKPELISPQFIKNSLGAWEIILSHPEVFRVYRTWVKNEFARGNFLGKIYQKGIGE